MLNALGVRKTTIRVDCSKCDGIFGSTIDNEVGQQVAVIRNLLQLDSGRGRPPPMLRSPDYSDEFVRARERFEAAMKHHVEIQRPRQLNRIADDVLEKNGIVNKEEPITAPQLSGKIAWEISQRFAAHALGLPHVENLTGEEIVARLREIRGKPEWAHIAGHPEPQQCHQESLLPQALLSTTLQNRKLLLPHQRLVVIGLQTAKAFSLAIPAKLLARLRMFGIEVPPRVLSIADEMIE